MMTAKRYLAYGLRKSLVRTVVLCAIAVIIGVMSADSSTSHQNPRLNSTGIETLAIMLGALATIIPMLELADFKNRRNLDTLYFFPIGRKAMAAVHFISGFVQVATIYTAASVASGLYLLAKTDIFALEYLIPYYFLSLALGLVIYSVICFIYDRANTVTDGVIICILWVFVIWLVASIARESIIKPFWGPDVWTTSYIEKWNESSYLAEWGILYAPLNNLTVIYQDLLEINGNGKYYADIYLEHSYLFYVWGAIGLAAALGFIYGFGIRGANMAGEPSSSWLGYKMLIPVYGYTTILYFASLASDISLIVMLFVAMLIGYVVYRRGFKLKRSDIIVMACGIIAALMGAWLGSMMPTYFYGF